MAYSRDLPKMAFWIEIAVILEILNGLVWFCWYSLVREVGGQMTIEFIHEEISIMNYNGLSWTIMRGGHDWHG